MNRPLLSLNEWFFVDGEWSATSDGEPALPTLTGEEGTTFDKGSTVCLLNQKLPCGITMIPCSNCFSLIKKKKRFLKRNLDLQAKMLEVITKAENVN